MEHTRARVAGAFACALFLAHCAPAGPAGASDRSGREEAARSYEVDGTIRRIDREEGSITIAHEDVPGYMPAMTMPFTVEDPHLFAGLSEGDRVHFRFVAAGGGRHVIESIRKL